MRNHLGALVCTTLLLVAGASGARAQRRRWPGGSDRSPIGEQLTRQVSQVIKASSNVLSQLNPLKMRVGNKLRRLPISWPKPMLERQLDFSKPFVSEVLKPLSRLNELAPELRRRAKEAATMYSGLTPASTLAMPANTRQPLSKSELESAIRRKECGKVPLYERLYNQSINATSDEPMSAGSVRILHGLDSERGEWPWVVRVTHCAEEEECGTCTGSLLNDRWIITAGHCAYGKKNVSDFKVTFGLYDLVSPENSSFTIGVEQAIVHPAYKDLNNDLTLMRLTHPVRYTDQVQPVCLVQATRNVIQYARRRVCYAIGYGYTAGMMDPTKLQKLKVTVREPSECNSDRLGVTQLKPGTVCIGPSANSVGSSCKGDSGGPDVCFDPKRGRWTLVGTVSYGPAQCDRENGETWLTVSVDLSNYRTWIMSTILAYS